MDLTNESSVLQFIHSRHHKTLRRRNNGQHFSCIRVHDVSEVPEKHIAPQKSDSQDTSVTCYCTQLWWGSKVPKIIRLDIPLPDSCSSCTYSEVNQRHPSVTPLNLPPCAVHSCKISTLQGIIFLQSILPQPDVPYWSFTRQSTSLDSCILSRAVINRQNL